MKTLFKVGDRVAFYMGQGRKTGCISDIYPDGIIQVDIFTLHPKQCRRLVKKSDRIAEQAKKTDESNVVYNHGDHHIFITYKYSPNDGPFALFQNTYCIGPGEGVDLKIVGLTRKKP